MAALAEAADPVSAPDAFTIAYRTHVRFVARMLRALGVVDAALDDAVQDVFVVVHRRWSDRPAEALVRRWLVAITRRVASRHRRGVRRWLTKLGALPTPGPGIELERHAQVREELARIQRFLDALPERQRLAFLLVDIEGLGSQEAADVLAVNVNTFQWRLAEARRRFARLREEGGRHG